MATSLPMEEALRLDDDQLRQALAGRDDVPHHVAIIMDGNGRWARKRFLPRLAGHRAGRHAVRRCVRICGELGVEVLTLYTFSQENFNRPEAEVKALWHFLQETLLAEIDDLARQNVRLSALGDMEQLPVKARVALQTAIDKLSTNTGLILNLALAYGGRQEIMHAALKLSRRLAAGELTADEVTEAEFRKGLYTPELADPDFMIRTSGEGRLSNFLLWQLAYAEILISPVLWPDFNERHLMLALVDYLNRERRFGALPSTQPATAGSDSESLLDPARWKRLLKVRP